jgi:hypothetical protein
MYHYIYKVYFCLRPSEKEIFYPVYLVQVFLDFCLRFYKVGTKEETRSVGDGPF